MKEIYQKCSLKSTGKWFATDPSACILIQRITIRRTAADFVQKKKNTKMVWYGGIPGYEIS